MLFRSQAGSWTLAGDLDDPSSMTGTLEVTELFDGEEEEPACTQDWALVGARAEEGCDACFTFEVEHTLLTSDGECRTPELPEDAEVRALGWERATDFDTGLARTVEWFRENRAWWEAIKSGEAFADYAAKNYGARG
mgnify:CR=1 FL=1